MTVLKQKRYVLYLLLIFHLPDTKTNRYLAALYPNYEVRIHASKTKTTQRTNKKR